MATGTSCPVRSGLRSWRQVDFVTDWQLATEATKCLFYLTALQASGGTIFVVLFWDRLSHLEQRFTTSLIRTTAVAAVFAIAAHIAVLSGMLGDDISSMWDWTLIQIILEGNDGRASALRALGLVTIAICTFAGVWARAAAVLGALAVAVSFSTTGHVSTLDQSSFARVLIVVHILGVAYWVGSLVPLFYLTSGNLVDFDHVAAILKRFGNIALFAVASLIAAGSGLLWLFLGSIEALLGSTYGLFFAAKLFLVASLLSLAAINKLWLTPGIAASELKSLENLRRSIVIEIVLVTCILIVTGIFTTVTGPPEVSESLIN